MDRSIRAYPHVRAKQRSVASRDVSEMRRARFLLAVKKEFEIRCRIRSRCFQSVESGEHRNDRGLVVRSRPRIEPPLGIEPLTRFWKRHDSPAGFKRLITQRWFERIGCPLRRFHRLAIVVRIEADRSSRPGCFHLTKDRRRPGSFKQSRLDTAAAHHINQLRRVAPDVLRIRSDVRNREQVYELTDDLRLVCESVGANAGNRGLSTNNKEYLTRQ